MIQGILLLEFRNKIIKQKTKKGSVKILLKEPFEQI